MKRVEGKFKDIMQKLVSAVIITHNRLDLLKKAIESVLMQSYGNIEIIVIDNYSNTDTVQYLAKIPNVIVKREKKFVNGNIARNHGVQLAKGDYVAFLDDDDEWKSNKIQEQVRVLEQCSNVGVVYTGMEKVYDHKFKNKEIISDYFSGNIENKVFTGMFATSSSLMIRKSLLNQFKFDEKLTHWQDYDLLVTLSAVTLFYAISDSLTVINVNTISDQRLSNQFEKWQEATKYFYSKHNDRIVKLCPADKRLMKLNYVNDALTRLDTKKGVYFKRVMYLFQRVYLSKSIKSFVYMIPGITFDKMRKFKSAKNNDK